MGFDGFLIMDKPQGWTSHQLVQKIRKTLGVKKVGHAGTLDPFATGLLILCLGKATKLSSLLASENKGYIGVMKLGMETDTYDLHGKIVRKAEDFHVSEGEIKKVFSSFTGMLRQSPPIFSAVKFKGKPLYYWARKGIHVEPKQREVYIHKLELKQMEGEHVTFEVFCSKGTYVRSLVHDIGKRLGVGAVLVELRRIKSGNFHIYDAISIEEFLSLVARKEIDKRIIPAEYLLQTQMQREEGGVRFGIRS